MKKLKYTDFMDALDEYGDAVREFTQKDCAPPLVRHMTVEDSEKMRQAKLKCLQIVHELIK